MATGMTCGVGGWGGPVPGDPSNNSILSATPAFGGIDVSWTYPTTHPEAVAYVKLYRALIDDFDAAILIAELGGGFFYDKLSTASEYFYWIRIVSRNTGLPGALIGPASAVARPTLAATIELLTGMIDEGLLSTTLRNQLDQISTLNTNLANEITDRETGETTLAEAMEAVTAGLAEAHTFILNEVATRTAEDSALAEAIAGVVVVIGDDIAASIVTLSASIDEITGNINAMYTAKVTVNGLVGGFGIINDGDEVEAGFDVDTFWIGRTSADKRKPFIIEDDVVYIDEGAINKLTFTKLRDETGDFIVEDGQVKATYIDTKGLVIRDALGNAVFSAGAGLNWDLVVGAGRPADGATVGAPAGTFVNGIPAANVNVWSAVTGSGKPANNADVTSANTAAGIAGQGALATQNYAMIGSTVRFASGTVMNTGDFVNILTKIGSGNIGTFIDGLAVTSAYIGNLAVSTAKIADLAVSSAKIAALAVGTAKIADLAVETVKVADQAITIPSGGFTATEAVTAGNVTMQSVTFTATGAPVSLFAGFVHRETAGSPGAGNIELQRTQGGTTTTLLTFLAKIEADGENSVGLPPYTDTPAAGTVTYTLRKTYSGTNYGVSKRGLFAIEVKK